MSEQTLGFTFREKMAGGFTLGVTDPEAGAATGHDAGNTMTMHATIEIDDLSRFISEAAHPGSITGQIDYPQLGFGIPSTSGVFNLFSPTGDLSMKYMVYELGFDAHGSKYYLAGKKEVRQGPLTDVWKATTTLYAQLHQGADKTGPVAGAGVLTLTVADLLAMIPTMHATNAGSPEEAAKAVARFGKFFLGELWDTYITKGLL